MVMPYTHSLIDIQGMTTWDAVQMQFMMSLLVIVVALNVAVLVYARTATRQGEIAVRAALGASRGASSRSCSSRRSCSRSVAAVVGLRLAQVAARADAGTCRRRTVGSPFWATYSLRPMHGAVYGMASRRRAP